MFAIIYRCEHIDDGTMACFAPNVLVNEQQILEVRSRKELVKTRHL